MSNYDSFDDNAEQTMFPHVDANYDDANDFYGDVTAEDIEHLYDAFHEEDGEDWDDEDYDYDDSMDGDHDSAMESAGWGTDEDYGYYGDDF